MGFTPRRDAENTLFNFAVLGIVSLNKKRKKRFFIFNSIIASVLCEVISLKEVSLIRNNNKKSGRDTPPDFSISLK